MLTYFCSVITMLFHISITNKYHSHHFYACSELRSSQNALSSIAVFIGLSVFTYNYSRMAVVIFLKYYIEEFYKHLLAHSASG